MLLVLRQAELYVLVNLGVYKNVEDLTDKEIISEYNKLKKQSNKLQKKISNNKVRGGDGGNSHDVRMVSGQTDRSSVNTNNEESVDEQKEDSLKGATKGVKMYLNRDSLQGAKKK